MRIHAASLLYFDTICRLGSFRAAARRLNVASSAINRQILKLEHEIGTDLFERVANGVRLTAAGEMLARHVTVVLQDLDRARSDIHELMGARLGHVAIAAAEGLFTSLLPAAVTRLRESAPRVTISGKLIGSLAIPKAITSGDVDIGIGFDVPRHSELRTYAKARFRIGAIMAPNHPLASRPSVSLSRCCEYPIIFAKADTSIERRLGPVIARLSKPMEPMVQSNSIEFMRELAERGAGIAFQTRVSLERSQAEGRLVHVPLNDGGAIWSELGIFVRAKRNLPGTTELVLKILAAELQAREASEKPNRA
jgi:DNA-binding transcriptional LysR family regulator